MALSINNLRLEGRMLFCEVENIPAARTLIDSLFGDLEVDIKKRTRKRSLDANAYCWVLIHKIAEAVKLSPIEVYRESIRNLGNNHDIVCAQNKSVESLIKGWEATGLGWLTDTLESKLDGCTNVILYYGSSQYDTKTMARLIDNLVQDCRELGIETKPQEEIDALMEGWSGKTKKA